MTITFTITNVIPDGFDVIAFYRFSNGYEWSNRFRASASLAELMSWGNVQAEKIKTALETAQQMADSLQQQIEEQT